MQNRNESMRHEAHLKSPLRTQISIVFCYYTSEQSPALLRRLFMPAAKKAVIRTLPGSAFPNHNR